MTTQTIDLAPNDANSLTAGQLPKYSVIGLLVLSLGLVAAVSFLLSTFSLASTFVVGIIVFLVATYAVSTVIEGRRKAADRTARSVVAIAFIIALLPLISLVWTTLSRGIERFDLEFFTYSMRNVVGAGGGAGHAIAGTLIITGIATIISVPIGLLTSVYLVEYGHGKLKRAITFFVDVMTGIPSIVAGLFAYALFSMIFGAGHRSGMSGAIALSVLMIPYVVRSAEEMLQLVPNELREASYALGVPKWRTIMKVVIPTSISGIVSGVILAIARVMGETAPLLVTAGLTSSMNTNPFEGHMTTLPVFVYYQYMTPGVPAEPYYARAWAGALTLILIVMLLNLIGRMIAKLFAPKTKR